MSSEPQDAPFAAIQYRGEHQHGVKGFWHGTQRSIPPAETLERVRPYFSRFGITRLANVTDLDRIGIPVTLAIRPNATTLSQGSGKGSHLEAALTSAAMEAIEVSVAEDSMLPTFQLAYRDLPGCKLAVEDLPLNRHNMFCDWWPYRWVMGWDLIHQEDVPLPWWMIHMGRDPLRKRDLSAFQVTSNGLASGNNLLEAINAGLFEVIERDAVACNRLAWLKLKRRPPVVDLETIEHPVVLTLLDHLRRAHVRCVLFDCTIDTAVPVYMAYIFELDARSVGVYRGYGAHLDPEIAMTRAITEAVQARVVYISGSRDDVFRHSYMRLKPPDNPMVIPAFGSLPPTVDARARTSQATATFEGDTRVALDKLRGAGLDRCIVVDLSVPDVPIRVVKVVVPGLEGYIFDFYSPGRRANAFLRELAQ